MKPESFRVAVIIDATSIVILLVVILRRIERTNERLGELLTELQILNERRQHNYESR